MTDWRSIGRAISGRVMYKAVCAGCGKERFTPVFTLTEQFCNPDCETAWRNAEWEAAAVKRMEQLEQMTRERLRDEATPTENGAEP